MTACGWFDLEFNDSSTVIGNMKSGLLSAQVIFAEVTARNCRRSANTENYKMNENETAKSPFANPWIQLIIGVVCMACVAKNA